MVSAARMDRTVRSRATRVTFCGARRRDTFNKGVVPAETGVERPSSEGRSMHAIFSIDRPGLPGPLHSRGCCVRWRAIALGWHWSQTGELPLLTLAALGLVRARRARLAAAAAFGAAQLSCHRPPALPARVASAPRSASTSSKPTTRQTPFSRQQRSIVYQRAKGAPDKRPFGTQLDQHVAGYEWINHSLVPTDIPTRRLPRQRRLGAELHAAV